MSVAIKDPEAKIKLSKGQTMRLKLGYQENNSDWARNISVGTVPDYYHLVKKNWRLTSDDMIFSIHCEVTVEDSVCFFELILLPFSLWQFKEPLLECVIHTIIICAAHVYTCLHMHVCMCVAGVAQPDHCNKMVVFITG